jgi:hypothetical protein
MNPTCLARHPASWRAELTCDSPATRTSPRLGRSMPAIRLSRVDFPDPLAPSARNSPFFTSRSMLERTGISILSLR